MPPPIYVPGEARVGPTITTANPVLIGVGVLLAWNAIDQGSHGLATVIDGQSRDTFTHQGAKSAILNATGSETVATYGAIGVEALANAVAPLKAGE